MDRVDCPLAETESLRLARQFQLAHPVHQGLSRFRPRENAVTGTVSLDQCRPRDVLAETKLAQQLAGVGREGRERIPDKVVLRQPGAAPGAGYPRPSTR